MNTAVYIQKLTWYNLTINSVYFEFLWGGGGSGRHTRLKICWDQSRGGSSPPRPIRVHTLNKQK